jgi:hypothetical protein
MFMVIDNVDDAASVGIGISAAKMFLLLLLLLLLWMQILDIQQVSSTLSPKVPAGHRDEEYGGDDNGSDDTRMEPGSNLCCRVGEYFDVVRREWDW